MADKVRYYLEQSVGELEDLEKRGIFTRQELAIVMRRRTDFEHRINGRTAKPRDFLRYAEYEMNVEQLRKKRLRRMHGTDKKNGGGDDGAPKKGGVSDWAGPRRIMFIFDRGTRKFTGDIPLWLQYLEYAKKQKAVNVVNKIFSRMLQLHPTKPSVWVLAAKHEAEVNAAMKSARSIMQRGLRFNADSEQLWLEYIKLELIYVSKILARRKLLGLRVDDSVQEEKVVADEGEDGHVELPGEDELTAKDIVKAELKSLPEVDISMLGDVSKNPALRGDVALIVFDAAIEALPGAEHKVSFAHKALSLFDEFEDLDRQHLCEHVVQYLLARDKASTEAQVLHVMLPVRHTAHDSVAFPDLLKLVMARYNGLDTKTPELRAAVRDHVTDKYLAPELVPPLDANIRLVLKAFVKKL